MSTFCILGLFFFLLWIFFSTTLSQALSRLGKTYSMSIIEKKNRFFYWPFHKWLFANRPFDLLNYLAAISRHLSRIGFAAFGLFCLFEEIPPPSLKFIIFAVLLLVAALLIGDFLPRLWVTKSPEKALTNTSFPGSLFLFLSFPFGFLFMKGIELTFPEEGEPQTLEPREEMREEILKILQSANVKERLSPADLKLLESVVHFRDRIVREVMMPRVNLFSLPMTMSVRDAAKELVKEGFTRTPVFKETIDQIVGVLMYKDILRVFMECDEKKIPLSSLDEPIETLAKAVFYTPETKKASQLLLEFRTKKMHMAIVVDEYGGTEGVVTIEDILEEIVGEIADEYDIGEERLYVRQAETNSWIVDGRMSIIDAEDTFNIRIPQEGDYDTIGGYIFHKVGSIPQKGLKIHHEHFDLEIISSTDKSIEKVKITPRAIHGEE